MSELPFMKEVPVVPTRLEQWKEKHYVSTFEPDELSPHWTAVRLANVTHGETESDACWKLAHLLNLPWTL